MRCRGTSFAGLAALLAMSLGGCGSVVPRSDLQAFARVLPPSPEMTPDERDRMAAEIRQRTGIPAFAFSDFEFTSETRLPSGTEWVVGMMIGKPDRP